MITKNNFSLESSLVEYVVCVYAGYDKWRLGARATRGRMLMARYLPRLAAHLAGLRHFLVLSDSGDVLLSASWSVCYVVLEI